MEGKQNRMTCLMALPFKFIESYTSSQWLHDMIHKMIRRLPALAIYFYGGQVPWGWGYHL